MNKITFLYKNYFEYIAVFGKDLVQRVDTNGIDQIGDEGLDDDAVAASQCRLLDLLGQLDRVHGGLQAVVVNGQLLVARVCGLNIF